MSDTPPPSIPLSPTEQIAKTHAILCVTGFLILLPIGALVARFLRTFSSRWWTAHWLIQLLISGPVIYAGWSFGHQTALMLDMGPFVDTHQKTGLALLILYVAQLLLGIFIHFFKFPSIFRGRRPPQNYLHVFLGAAIFILAAFQAHYGLYTEWLILGGLHHIPQAAKNAWLALIIIFWGLYLVGMTLLPRQWKQEELMKVEENQDIPLHDTRKIS